MRIILFYHSFLSDWNHGNAHFLRGIVSEFVKRGHEVVIYEPRDAWSLRNLLKEYGRTALEELPTVYTGFQNVRYDPGSIDLDLALLGADLVLVHEWNEPDLVRRIGMHHKLNRGYLLFFHDTHHRSVTDRSGILLFDLSNYDGVLAFGEAVKRFYLAEDWAERVWVWHEAADTNVFRPFPGDRERDVVWIGNWGDEERTLELREFFIEPVKSLGLSAQVYGVRYPDHALSELTQAGIEYQGWTPNYKVPRLFSTFKLTLHIPRRPYTQKLPGIPTIRVFEALACGIPLVCSAWEDSEGLFSPGQDFLMAQDGQQMKKIIRDLVSDSQMAREIADHGLQTILKRHTCSHRVDELFSICHQLGKEPAGLGLAKS